QRQAIPTKALVAVPPGTGPLSKQSGFRKPMCSIVGRVGFLFLTLVFAPIDFPLAADLQYRDRLHSFFL
ncbi:MAG: hypothetical protein OSB18_00280, partial [SAR324 cluster bacterium]|nr:hypothetical protein [SAR324 cluster bacterium]